MQHIRRPASRLRCIGGEAALSRGVTTVGIATVILVEALVPLLLLAATGTAVAIAFAVFSWADPLGLSLFALNQTQTEPLAVFWGAVAFCLLLAHRRFLSNGLVMLAGGTFSAAVLSKQPAACWLLPL